MKLKLTLEYDGAAFCGWQQQDGVRTVQGELERALETYLGAAAKKLGMTSPGRPSVSGSGRTDSGVHARGQVASFSWPDSLPLEPYELRGALNGITPHALFVRNVELVDEKFDARLTRHVKQYSYYIGLHRGADGYFADRLWQVHTQLNIPAMIQAAKYFCGEHDFSSFRALDCCAKSATRRLMVSEVTRLDSQQLVYLAQGNGFLKQMIRIIVGTIVAVGKGILTPADIPRIIQARSRQEAGETAPACGLVLDWVKYGQGIVLPSELDDE